MGPLMEGKERACAPLLPARTIHRCRVFDRATHGQQHHVRVHVPGGRRCSRVVFVGNIPFHASEAELRDACELIGPVRSLRVAADPATGRRRGYAFVEYPDDETARSACRNLGGHDLRGRELRVCITARRGTGEPVGLEDAIHAASLVSGAPPPDAVTRYLAARSARELRKMAAALEAAGALALLEERVPGLAAAAEQVGHLLEMAAADDAAEEARRSRKRAAAAADSDDDRRAKLAKVGEEARGCNKDKIAASVAGVACF